MTEQNSEFPFDIRHMEDGLVTRFTAQANIPHDPDIQPQIEGVESVMIGLPYGYCGGVRMALAATLAARKSNPNVRVGVNQPPVHNDDALKPLRDAGVETDSDLTGLSPGDIGIYSAHGSDARSRAEAGRRGLIVYDAACPFVTKTHHEIQRAAEKGSAVVYISFSSPGHPEAVAAKAAAEIAGTPLVFMSQESDISEILNSEEVKRHGRISVVGQTTNNSGRSEELADSLQARAAKKGLEIVNPYRVTDVCNTVRDRIMSAVSLVRLGLRSVVVVGSVKSQNTSEIADAAQLQAIERVRQRGPNDTCEIYIVNSWLQLPKLKGIVGVVSGASTPSENVEGIAEYLNPRSPVVYVGEDTDRGRTFQPSDPKLRRLMGVR